MSQLGVWRIGEHGPQRVQPATVDFEAQLESWIERDPGLLEAGLRIVGRQVRTEAGPVDLLGVDPQGRWVVIELKRGRLYRDALAQALDYAACVAAMPEEEIRSVVNDYLRGRDDTDRPGVVEDQVGQREFRVCVVGLSRDPSLDRVVRFLSESCAVPITVITFEAYSLPEGGRLLVRQLSESEALLAPTRTVESVAAEAEVRGVGVPFRKLVETAERNGLYLRPWKRCVMVAPPANRSRALFTVWNEPDGDRLVLWLGTEAIAEFYPPLTEEEIKGELGPGGWRKLTEEDADGFASALDRLFARVCAGDEGGESV